MAGKEKKGKRENRKRNEKAPEALPRNAYLVFDREQRTKLHPSSLSMSCLQPNHVMSGLRDQPVSDSTVLYLDRAIPGSILASSYYIKHFTYSLFNLFSLRSVAVIAYHSLPHNCPVKFTSRGMLPPV